ncbi:MAG: helix-turn-helix domain-containing protein [Opitutaceae bacterium]|jgi:DNA-binding transcriptional regulator YiaG
MNITEPNTNPEPRIEQRAYEVSIPSADGESLAYKVPLMVWMEWDATINEWLLTPEAMDEIEATKARHMGLLTADEIRTLRERLKLTQAHMAELLKIGAKTWTRWETGKQRPSQSLNLLLRALQCEILTPYMLKQLGASQVDWTPALAASVEMTQPITLPLAFSLGVIGSGEEMPLAS